MSRPHPVNIHGSSRKAIPPGSRMPVIRSWPTWERERERKRKRPASPTKRTSSLVESSVAVVASVAINSDCTRESHSDLAISSSESRVRRITLSLSPRRCGRPDRKSRRSEETFGPYDGRYRDVGTVACPIVVLKRETRVEGRIRGSSRRDSIDIDFPRVRVLSVQRWHLRKWGTLRCESSRASRLVKPDAISFPVSKWRNRAQGDGARLCRAPLRKTERA